MRYNAILLSLAAAATVSAQAPQKYGSELDMKVDPGSVDPQEVASWCQGQTNTCSTLCNKSNSKNDCDSTTLTYNCECASNNSAPGLQFYSQTLPTYICFALFGQCNMQNIGNADNQKACETNIRDLCATQDPPKNAVEGDSSTGVSSMAMTATGTSTATATDGSATSTSSDGFAAPTAAPLGNGVAAIAAIGMLAYLV